MSRLAPPQSHPRFEQRFTKELAWATEHFPSQSPAVVVTAMELTRLAGDPITTGTVRKRLKATGRWHDGSA